ncbi:MAG: hypothetical protein AAF386_07955, partial [Pseudomonadota bacterium]
LQEAAKEDNTNTTTNFIYESVWLLDAMHESEVKYTLAATFSILDLTKMAVFAGSPTSFGPNGIMIDAATQDFDYFKTFNIAIETKTIWPMTKVGNPLFWARIDDLNETLLQILASDKSFEMWSSWYEKMLAGQPWKTTYSSRLASLPPEDWHQGPAHIAEKIREIEEDLLAEKSQLAETRGPTPEEVSTERAKSLLEKSTVVAASMAALDETLSYRLDLFQRMEKPNLLPSFASTLSTIPEMAQCISQIVSGPAGQDGTDQKLAVEVGRLQAQVEQLKKDLKAALGEIEELKKKPWYRSSSLLLGGGAIGALITGLWVLSGEDKTLERRWDKLAVDLQFLCGKIWCEEEDRVSEPLRFELPESHEI